MCSALDDVPCTMYEAESCMCNFIAPLIFPFPFLGGLLKYFKALGNRRWLGNEVALSYHSSVQCVTYH